MSMTPTEAAFLSGAFKRQKEWQRCPVCEGHGIVPNGFYTHPAGQSFVSASTGPETCRQCDGQGMVARP